MFRSSAGIKRCFFFVAVGAGFFAEHEFAAERVCRDHCFCVNAFRVEDAAGADVAFVVETCAFDVFVHIFDGLDIITRNGVHCGDG